MPFGRGKRTIRSALRKQNQIEANGDAWLCFAKDHSWFQGNINTDDESNYSLYGEKRKENPDPVDELIENGLLELEISEDGESGNNKMRRDSRSSESTESTSSEDGEENNNISRKKNPGSKLVNSSAADEYYSVILTDHFSGLRYQLPRIYVNKAESEDESTEEKNLFVCADGQISFQVDRVFKGQKADMMIQQHFGSPTLLGQKCLVYHGPMSIIFNETLAENERSWCL